MSATKKFVLSVLTGAIMVSGAWAGASLMPVATDETSATVADTVTAVVATPATPGPKAAAKADPEPEQAPVGASEAPIDPSSLPAGQVLAGAAKISIEPRPQDYNGTWEKSHQKCATLSENEFANLMEDPAAEGDHFAAAGSTWPENPNCIYQGGFGLGPMNPVTGWDETLGLWVRAVALRDKQGDDLVLVILDGEGYFWDYDKKCTDCGIKQLTDQLAATEGLGLEAKNIVIAATHAHSSPDFIGGWGFVPDWYMKQVADTIKSTVKEAVGSMRPAVLEHGEELARSFNSERRGTYRSAEEQELVWLRAYAPDNKETIATIGAYAAHPTAFGGAGGKAHPDWPGVFEKSLEDRFGGIGMHFMTGLGNMSNSGLGTRATDLAGLVADVSHGNEIENPDIKTARSTWIQPVTNVPLTALGAPGFFDRKFVQGPATVQPSKDDAPGHCTSTSPVAAEVAASAARIGGEFALTASPGEIFANLSNSIKEKSGAIATMPLGQANDALGYMPQSFELNQVGQQGLGFAVDGAVFVNYEDSYAIDKCYGDQALETAIDLLDTLPK